MLDNEMAIVTYVRLLQDQRSMAEIYDALHSSLPILMHQNAIAFLSNKIHFFVRNYSVKFCMNNPDFLTATSIYISNNYQVTFCVEFVSSQW